jgi:hypothetical protein
VLLSGQDQNTSRTLPMVRLRPLPCRLSCRVLERWKYSQYVWRNSSLASTPLSICPTPAACCRHGAGLGKVEHRHSNREVPYELLHTPLFARELRGSYRKDSNSEAGLLFPAASIGTYPSLLSKRLTSNHESLLGLAVGLVCEDQCLGARSAQGTRCEAKHCCYLDG